MQDQEEDDLTLLLLHIADIDGQFGCHQRPLPFEIHACYHRSLVRGSEPQANARARACHAPSHCTAQ
eukprot:3802046-Pyramimonas_sp.AAC.1